MKPQHMITVSVVLLILGFGLLLFMPFLKFPPGKDEIGYFMVGRNAERIYSEDAQKAYWSYHITTVGSALAFISAIGFFGFGWTRKYKKK